jgi:hypothetical protein
MANLAATAALATALLSGIAIAEPARPTIVLVHGPFAEPSSWNGFVASLKRGGYTTVDSVQPASSALPYPTATRNQRKVAIP